jgi:signal transduction histidine kinase/DNA-binding response OmpR family regulator
MLFLHANQVLLAQTSSRATELERQLKTEENHQKIIEILLELAEYYEESNPDAALRSVQRALTIARNTNDYSNTSRALLFLGKVERNDKNYDHAIEVYYEALSNAEKVLNYLDITHCFIEIANTYLEQGKYEQADEFLDKAQKVGAKTQDPEIVAVANLGQSRREISQSKFYLASEYLQIALEKSTEANNTRLQLEVLTELGKLQMKIDEKQLAEQYFLRGIELAESVKDNYHLAVIHYELGELYQRKTDYDKALIHMSNSLSFAQDAGLKVYIKKGYQNLSEVYVKNGDYKRAYEYLRYFSAVKDAKEISELESRLSIEAKEKEIQLLNKQREFDRQQQKTSRTIIILLSVIIISSIVVSVFLLRINKSKNQAILMLKEAKESAEKSEKEKEVFLTYISHEMRTPLNAIVGFTKMLSESSLNTEQRKNLKIIESSAENILLIVNDVLDLSKIESGAIVLNNVSFNLTELIEEIIQTLQFKVKDKPVKLIFEKDEKFPNYVKGDPVRIRQIILNLADNAVKFTENGHVSVRLKAISTSQNSVKFRIEVEDSGVGIRQSKLKNIFNRYEQESANTTRKYGGTGLGLAITKQLVELMGGKIEVESTYGQGSKFSFDLSLKTGKSTLVEVAPKPGKLGNIRILIVDDNDLNREIFVDAVKGKSSSVNIDSAEDGRMAIRKITENDYDVVIMDIQMPRMNGLEATKFIRSKIPPPKCDIPIIAMTAHALEDAEQKALDAGMNDYVTKPVNTNELIRKIDKVLQNKKVSKNIQSVEEMDVPMLSFEQLNHGVILELTGGKPEKIEKYMNLFLNNAPKDIEEMKEFLDHENWDELAQVAHKLKGAVSYLGAEMLVRQLKEAETFNKEERNFKYCEEIVNSIERNINIAFVEAQLLLKTLKEEKHDS